MPTRSASPTPGPGKSEPSFEEALAGLQEVVSRLESGALTLDETISFFRQGSELASKCQRMIAEAELQITELVNESDQEHIGERSFTEPLF